MGVQPELAFADCPPRRGDLNSKPSPHVRRHPRFRASAGERRELERFEAEPNLGRTNSLRHGCSCVRVIVARTRAEFRPCKPQRHWGFKSTPLRHTVCTVYLQSGDGDKWARAVGFSCVMRTGETRLPAACPDLAEIVSRRGKFGSLQGSSAFRPTFTHPSLLGSLRCVS